MLFSIPGLVFLHAVRANMRGARLATRDSLLEIRRESSAHFWSPIISSEIQMLSHQSG